MEAKQEPFVTVKKGVVELTEAKELLSKDTEKATGLRVTIRTRDHQPSRGSSHGCRHN